MSDQSDIAIEVSGVTKAYRIWRDPAARLKLPLLQALGSVLPRSLQPTKLRTRIGTAHQTPYYKDFYALRDVSFSINKGEAVGIIGRNGSGKSTLLQLIVGTLTPSAGAAQINGRVAALLELGSGFNPEFTGRENVYLNAGILGLTHEETDASFANIAAFADIGDFLEQPVRTYSSGMIVRLAFSVAVHVQPDILIVDEALAVGDTAFQAKCMQRIQDFIDRGITVLMVSHDLNSILQFSSRCFLLDGGRLVHSGDPKEVVDSYKRLLLGESASHQGSKHQDLRLQQLREESTWARNYDFGSVCAIYGNGKVRIDDFGVFSPEGERLDALLEMGACCVFKMKVRFLQNVVSPILTLTIRDISGREITGTNTSFENIDTGTGLSGETVIASFSFKLRLAPNNYLVTFACSGYENEFVVHERLYHILPIRIYSRKKTVGHFDLESAVTIRHA